MPLKSLDKVLLDELKDLYSAENQILKALPKMAKAASSPLLKEAFTSHIEQTRGQVERLDRIARLMGEKSFKGKKCKAMEGLLEEGTELIEEGGDPAVLDAAMIGAAQKVEHYEIAGYGTARTHARHLGHEQVARLLQETLDEEGQTDKNLTKIAQRKINLDAKAEGDDGGGRKGGAKGAAKGGAKKSAAKGGASKGAAKGGAKKGATKSAARSGGAKSGGAKSGGAKGAAKGGAKSGAKSGARGTSGGSTSGMSRGGRAGAGSVAGESRTSAREGAGRIARSAAATRTSMPGPGVTSRSLPAGTKRGGGATKTAGGRATASRSTSPAERATTSRPTSPAGRAKEAPAGRASAARSTRTGGEAKAAPQARTTAAPATTAPATTAPATSSPTVSPSTPAGGSAAPTSGVTPSSRTAPGGDVGQGRFGGGGGGGDASQAEIERAGLGPEDIEHTIEEIRSGEIAGGFSGADDFVEGESFEGADEGGNAGDAYDASTGG